MRVCCVNHSASGLVGGITGGAERQVAMLAVSLAARGHQVSLVVPGYGGEPETVHGVRLRRGWERDRGVRVVRSLTYRGPTLFRTLVDERADVYYVRGRAHFTPVVMMAARRMGAVSLLGLANDQDLLEDRGRLPYGLGGSPLAAVAGRVEYAWFRRGAILAADWVVTQHEGQSAQCARMGLRHLLVPNIVAAPADAPPVTHQDHDAVWVGNVHREGRSRKGLAELVGLAERTRELSFAVAGHFSSEAADASLARLDALPHVTVYGALSHDETLALIARSRVVINTSAWEGLSNVMLEGWSLYRPTVSLNVDPNGTLSSGELGVWAGGELDRMAEMVTGLVANEAARREMGERCAAYVRRTHGADAVCAQYEALFGDVAEERALT